MEVEGYHLQVVEVVVMVMEELTSMGSHVVLNIELLSVDCLLQLLGKI